MNLLTNPPFLFCLLFAFAYSQQVDHLFRMGDNRTISFRTTRDIEENIIFSEIKHTRNYIDEVYFNIN
jgi:hypothetical protein